MIYPAIPGALDLPLLIQAAAAARTAGLGIWAVLRTLRQEAAQQRASRRG